MKTYWIHKISLILLVMFTASSCDFFTNDPGILDPKVEDGLDLSISNVQAPVSALVGDEIPFNVVLENRGSSAIAQEITITAVHQQGDSVLTQEIFTEGIPSDSAIALTVRWNTLHSEEGTHSIVFTHDFEDQDSSNNAKLVNLTLTQQQDQDLAITTMSVPSEITQGDDAQIHVTLTNIGSEEIEDGVTLSFFRDSEENMLGTQTLNDDLESGDSRSFVFIWNTDSESPGSYEIIAHHSFEDNTPQNNRGALPTTIQNKEPANEPDLAITAIEAPETVEKGAEVEITATFHNNGNEDVKESVEIVLKNETSDEVIDVIEFDEELIAGESSNLTFTWNTSETDEGDYTLSVSHNFEDNSLENNKRSITVTVKEPRLIDLSVVNFRGPSELDQGEEIDLAFTISNTGQVPISEEDITIEVTDLTDDILIESRRLESDIEVGESQEIDLKWMTHEASVGEHSLRVSLELEDDNRNNNSRDLKVLIQEPDLNFAVSSFSPDEMKRNREEDITIKGTGFVEGVTVDFFRKEDDDDKDDDDDDDDDDKDDDEDDDDDENAPKPSILDINYIDENTLEITVRTWWWGSRKVNWNARLTHPDGEEIEFKNALKIRD